MDPAKSPHQKETEQGSIRPSPPQPHDDQDPPRRNSPPPFLVGQTSIYSLTLDEFQNTIGGETGKAFGSMNMDELLNTICTAEEQQIAMKYDETVTSNPSRTTENRPAAGQSGLIRQSSLCLLAPLSQRTVEEVWTEIDREQQQEQQQKQRRQQHHHGASTSRQLTFGEMTLEDFLVKAGVVRQPIVPSSVVHQAAGPPFSNQVLVPSPAALPLHPVGPHHGAGPVVSLGHSDPRNTVNGVSYQTYPQSGGIVGEGSSYLGSGSRNGGGYSHSICFNGDETSDGMSTTPIDWNMPTQHGRGKGKKRIIDGPAERVGRQRRMIKNRESAARSRARKQAYDEELEAELNHLKEENARLKKKLAVLAARRRQQQEEESKETAPSNEKRGAERPAKLRRSMSWP